MGESTIRLGHFHIFPKQPVSLPKGSIELHESLRKSQIHSFNQSYQPLASAEKSAFLGHFRQVLNWGMIGASCMRHSLEASMEANEVVTWKILDAYAEDTIGM